MKNISKLINDPQKFLNLNKEEIVEVLKSENIYPLLDNLITYLKINIKDTEYFYEEKYPFHIYVYYKEDFIAIIDLVNKKVDIMLHEKIKDIQLTLDCLCKNKESLSSDLKRLGLFIEHPTKATKNKILKIWILIRNRHYRNKNIEKYNNLLCEEISANKNILILNIKKENIENEISVKNYEIKAEAIFKYFKKYNFESNTHKYSNNNQLLAEYKFDQKEDIDEKDIFLSKNKIKGIMKKIDN